MNQVLESMVKELDDRLEELLLSGSQWQLKKILSLNVELLKGAN